MKKEIEGLKKKLGTITNYLVTFNENKGNILYNYILYNCYFILTYFV